MWNGLGQGLVGWVFFVVGLLFLLEERGGDLVLLFLFLVVVVWGFFDGFLVLWVWFSLNPDQEWY